MVYRIYVEKKPGFDVEANGLKNELTGLLGIRSLTGLRLLNRYDVEGIDEVLFHQCVSTVFSEPPVDNTYAQLPDEENVTVYHSGTALTEDGQLVTNGGRVLGVTATGPRLTNALSHAYEAAEKIHFDKLHKRSDIGLRALKALAEKQ